MVWHVLLLMVGLLDGLFKRWIFVGFVCGFERFELDSEYFIGIVGDNRDIGIVVVVVVVGFEL